MKESMTSSLWSGLGARLHRLRVDGGYRQEDVAKWARRLGLRWSRATVMSLEAGRRHLTVEEFLLLPLVLGGDLGRIGEDRKPLIKSLSDLLPPGDARIELEPPGVAVHARLLRAALNGDPNLKVGAQDLVLRKQEAAEAVRHLALLDVDVRALWEEYWPQAPKNARDTARVISDAANGAEGKLGIELGKKHGGSPLEWSIVVAIVALKLWAKSLTEKRDEEVAKRVAPNASSRTIQAARGHVTRPLSREIQNALKRSEHGRVEGDEPMKAPKARSLKASR